MLGNKKHKRIVLTIFLIVILFIISIIIQAVFEDKWFSKKDAQKLLLIENISLQDDFTLLTNESYQIFDYYHSFVLKISNQDTERIVLEIKNSDYFNKPPDSIPLNGGNGYYEGKIVIKNYQTDTGFVREFFKPQGKGYAPIYRVITVDPKENTLEFIESNE